MKEKTILISNKDAKKYRRGYPLLVTEKGKEMPGSLSEGDILLLRDSKGDFIARGYCGMQNKGYGWILSTDETERIDSDFFGRKISEAIRRRKAFYEDEMTTAFRAFNGEGDGIGGITIDYFDGYYMVTWYSEGIYRFKDMVINALKKAPHIKGIYEKRRFDKAGTYKDGKDHVFGQTPEFPLIVLENGARFAIYLDDGPMTGVFLDQRNVRRIIRDSYSRGQSVLNTFSYTGAFSVFAALGRAEMTTSVDLAKRSRERTREQFEINGINPDEQYIVVGDVFDYFNIAKKKGLTFDVVILDPPSFARSKKRTFSSSKDYSSLISDASGITKDGGLIVASTNNATFDMKSFKKMIAEGMDSKYEIIDEQRLPSDFRTLPQFSEGNYLKVLFIRKKNQ